MRKVLFIIGFFLIVALFPVNAKADTISLSGTVTVTGFLGSFNVSVAGFDSNGTTFSAFGLGSSISGTNIPRPTFVTAGNLINLSSSLFLLQPDFIVGSVTINGSTFPLRTFNLQVQSTSVMVPVTNADLLSLTAPCTVSGGVSGAPTPFTVVGAGFTGLCSAQLNLVRTGTNSAGNGLYNFQSITFSLSSAPIPEPATLLLLGSAMIGVIIRVTRKH